jgi:hypothetical protein
VPQLRPILEQWQNQTLNQTSRDDLAVIIRNIDKLIETCQSLGDSLLFGNLIVDYLQSLRKQATYVENIPPEQQTLDPNALIEDLNSLASGNDLMDLLLDRLDNVVFWSQMGSKIRDQDLSLIKQVVASIENFIEKNEKSKLNLEPLIEITRNLHLEQEKLIPRLPRILDELRIILGKFRLGQPVELLPTDIELATADVLLQESMKRIVKVSQKATMDLIKGQVRNLEAFQLDVNNFRAEIIEKINKSSKDPIKIREMWDKVFSLIESFAKNTSNPKQYDEINKWPYEHEQINLRSELQAIEKIFDSLADSINEFISPIATSSDSFSSRILHSDFMSLSGMIRALKITQRKPIKYHQLDAWRKE